MRVCTCTTTTREEGRLLGQGCIAAHVWTVTAPTLMTHTKANTGAARARPSAEPCSSLSRRFDDDHGVFSARLVAYGGRPWPAEMKSRGRQNYSCMTEESRLPHGYSVGKSVGSISKCNIMSFIVSEQRSSDRGDLGACWRQPSSFPRLPTSFQPQTCPAPL